MQPIKRLAQTLADLADGNHAVFSPADLRAVLPKHHPGAFRALLSRAVKDRLLRRICRGLYLYSRADYSRGLILYHAAVRLRADAFNYISLESALSDAGAISQIPMNHVTLMSSGRTATIRCGEFGVIEFVHTKKRPGELTSELTYDWRCHLWRASVGLAIRDMKAAKRSLDLVDWETVDESI